MKFLRSKFSKIFDIKNFNWNFNENFSGRFQNSLLVVLINRFGQNFVQNYVEFNGGGRGINSRAYRVRGRGGIALSLNCYYCHYFFPWMFRSHNQIRGATHVQNCRRNVSSSPERFMKLQAQSSLAKSKFGICIAFLLRFARFENIGVSQKHRPPDDEKK